MSNKISGGFQRMVHFLVRILKRKQFEGYDDGCEYCIRCDYAKITKHCSRGMVKNYTKCGLIEEF